MGGILMAIQLTKGNASEISEGLFRDHGIVVRPFPDPGLNSLRVSPNLMNSEEEMERLLTLLGRVG